MTSDANISCKHVGYSTQSIVSLKMLIVPLQQLRTAEVSDILLHLNSIPLCAAQRGLMKEKFIERMSRITQLAC